MQSRGKGINVTTKQLYIYIYFYHANPQGQGSYCIYVVDYNAFKIKKYIFKNQNTLNYWGENADIYRLSFYLQIAGAVNIFQKFSSLKISLTSAWLPESDVYKSRLLWYLLMGMSKKTREFTVILFNGNEIYVCSFRQKS